jgi:type IV secretory pathway protease TraF
VITLAVIACAAALALFGWPRANDLILYSHSSSLPVGLYLRANASASPGAIVTVRAREVTPDLAKAREFDGPKHRFLKRLAAGGGAVVCRTGDVLRSTAHRPRPSLQRVFTISVGAAVTHCGPTKRCFSATPRTVSTGATGARFRRI